MSCTLTIRMNFILRSAFLALCLLSITSYLPAQINTPSSASPGSQITGKILDSKTSQPVDFATVSLFLRSASQPVKVVQSDIDGSFKIANISDGTYILKISFLGYQPYSSDSLAIASNTVKNVG